MKKLISISILMLLVSFSIPAWAQEETKKGASAQAYEHASDNAIFNRTSDWFATIGKSKEEKEQILAERKAERAAKRAEKEAKKAQKKAEQEAKKAQKGLDEASREVKKKMGEANKGAEGFIKRQGQGKKK